MEETKKNIYPTLIEFKKDINDGTTTSNVTRELVDARNAIHLKITINSNDYPVSDVVTGIKEIFQKVLQCFDE